jgi:hypothetical protein
MEPIERVFCCTNIECQFFPVMATLTLGALKILLRCGFIANYIFFLPAVPFQMQGGATPKAPMCGPMTQMRYEALTAGPMPRLAERAADEGKPYG